MFYDKGTLVGTKREAEGSAAAAAAAAGAMAESGGLKMYDEAGFDMKIY